MTQLFCPEFPFGRGGLAEKRARHMSEEVLLDRCLRLSTRQFQSNRFVLWAYERLQRQKGSNKAVLQGKTVLQNGMAAAEAYGRLSPEQIIAAVKYAQECAEAQRQGRPWPEAPQMASAATHFIKSMELATGAMEHTAEHAQQLGAGAKAMTEQLGPGHLFLTLNTGELDTVGPPPE